MNKSQLELYCSEIEEWSIWVYEGMTSSDHEVPEEQTKYYLENILQIELASAYSYKLINQGGLSEKAISMIEELHEEITIYGYLNL